MASALEVAHYFLSVQTPESDITNLKLLLDSLAGRSGYVCFALVHKTLLSLFNDNRQFQ